MDYHERKQQFSENYAECERKLFRYILLLVPHHSDALDVLQETASDLWRKYDSYDSSRSFEAWARSFAHLRVLKHFEQADVRNRRWAAYGQELIEAVSDEYAQHASVLDFRRDALGGCMELLSDAEIELLRQRYWIDANLRVYARSLGVPEQRLYDRLRSIRGRLQDCIDSHVPRLEESQ